MRAVSKEVNVLLVFPEGTRLGRAMGRPRVT